MLHLLIDQLRQERRRCQAHRLVVSLEALAKLHDQALKQELANLGKLRIDNGDHGSVDGRKGQTGRLCLHDGSAKEAAAADEILTKELGDNVLDIGCVDLVDEAVDALL